MTPTFNGPNPEALLDSFVKGSMNVDGFRTIHSTRGTQHEGDTLKEQEVSFLARCGKGSDLIFGNLSLALIIYDFNHSNEF